MHTIWHGRPHLIAFDPTSSCEQFVSAAWFGARIILEQVSPESRPIFDFILELRHVCSGDWDAIAERAGIERRELQQFLTYAASFLSNIGNHYGSGYQKFTTGVVDGVIQRLASLSPTLPELHALFAESINAIAPYSLGFPSDTTQSGYYPGELISEEEIVMVSRTLEQNSIFPENTRIRKAKDEAVFEVLVASAQSDDDRDSIRTFPTPDQNGVIRLIRGDNSPALRNICNELTQAAYFAANDTQVAFIRKYMESFQKGSLDTYQNISGFVEPYRDPYGIRAEFEGLVAIADDKETQLLTRLVENSARFICRLPWATAENGGKGPFEKNLFEPSEFSSIHSLAYCSSIIFSGINLTNYNDICQEQGFKNVIISNTMATESQALQYPFINPSEAETFTKHKFPAYHWLVVRHELLGHGTGQMMVESEEGKHNFDINNPPVNSFTGKPIASWYKPGQTCTGQFADLATTVDECRAKLVGAYLMNDLELLELFGFTASSEITADNLTFNMYQQLGVDGLRALSNLNIDIGKWDQAHNRAHFAILKCLLLDGNGVVTVVHDGSAKTLRVRIDRSKILSHGKPALGNMLLRFHMYRCTADASACRAYYGRLSTVGGEYLEWRETVLANKPPPFVFIQANTFLDSEKVVLKEYEPTAECVIQSWAERGG